MVDHGGPEPAGRLELTWTNKHLRLLAHEDGRYEWTDPWDHRVAEVRLLRETKTVGDVRPQAQRASDNLLLRGDALHALTALTRVPDLAREYLGKVKLAYLDPPFNTGQTFPQYEDGLEHSVWLTMLRDRVLQLRRLLHPTGTLWLHLDSSEVHRARCVLDEVFGASNFLSTVVWQRTTAKSLARRTMGTMHESLLVYGASEDAVLQTLHLPHADEYLARRYTQEDERGRFDTGDLTASSYRPHLDSGKPWRGFDPSSLRRCWAVPRAPLVEVGLSAERAEQLSMREKLDVLDEHGLIHWPAAGGFPRLKRYLSDIRGRAVGDLWTDINVINSQAGERSGFATQKPEALLDRVIRVGTQEGDIVLDCFLGSGTTAAVAHKLRRHWVGVEWSSETVDTFIVPRLSRVVNGEDLGGVTEAAGWRRGGGFRVLDVGPSMFQVDGGRVVLAEWATNGALAEAIRAHGGWEAEDAPPFCGRKGRMRLAVVDGLVTADVALLLAGWLDTGEVLVLYGTAVDPDARPALVAARRGSSVKRIPQSLLSDYRRGRRGDDAEWAVELEPEPQDEPAPAGVA